MKQSMKRKLKIVFINLLILAIGLLCLELVFGNWLSPNRLNSLNLVLGAQLSYDVGDLYQSDNRQIKYTRDSYGLRGNYGKPSDIDLLTVGGSATDQRFITDGATWQDILQSQFLAHGKTVHVANAGVDGQSTYGHIKDFDWWFPNIPHLKARYVLFYIGVNDLLNVSNRDDNGFDDMLEHPSSTWGNLQRKIEERSALYYLYRTLRGMYRAHVTKVVHSNVDFQSVQWTDTPRCENHEQLMSASLQSYENRLRLLDERVRRLGAVPVYVTQPVRRCKYLNGRLIGVAETIRSYGLQMNGVDSCIMLQLLNRKTIEFCRASGGICIDLASEQQFDDTDFYDFYHNTPRGTEKIGRYLYEKLSNLF